MVPVRCARLRRELVRRADGGQHGERIGLGVERVDGARRAGPVARHRHVVADAGRHHALAGGRRVLVLRPDLEQRRIGQAARLVARRGVDQVGQDRGPHGVERRRRSSSAGAGRLGAAAEALGLLARQERPGHGLVHAARGQRPARLRRAALHRRRAPASRSPSRRGSEVVGMLSKPYTRVDFLDQVGLADDIRPPRRHGRRPRAVAARRRSPAWPGSPRSRRPARRLPSASSRGRGAGCSCAARSGMTPLETISLASPPHSSRIRRVATSAPHRPIADRCRARSDSARRTGCRACGPSAAVLDRHRSRRLRGTPRWCPRCTPVSSPPMMPPMPCTPLASAITGDRRIERVGLAVERQDLLALARLAHDQVAGELPGVEHVQRPVEVEGHQVGDVDQRRDRPQADRLQPALQPVGRGAVLDAAEVAADHDGAGAVGLGLVAVRPLDRALIGAGDLVRLHRLQRAERRPRRGRGRCRARPGNRRGWASP